jgi:hypothetical protein
VKPVIEKHFVILHVTVQEHEGKQNLNNPGGEELMKQVGGDGGLPYFAFLSPSGEVLANSTAPGKDGKKGGNIGHPFQPSEVDWFLVMLHKAAPDITPDEVAPLEKYLRAQKK